MAYARTLEFVNSLNAIDSLAAFKARYVEFLGTFGIKFFVISGIPEVATRLNNLLAVDNLPAPWRREYEAKGYLNHDPIVRRCMEMETPFSWSDVDNALINASERVVLERAAQHGLINGVCIPIHGINGFDAGCSFSGSEKPLDSEGIRALHLSALYAFNAVRRIHKTSALRAESLTERERDILRWCALGKTSTEIANAVCIAENTVNTHVKSALRKLSASNKTEAVATAIRLRLIAA